MVPATTPKMSNDIAIISKAFIKTELLLKSVSTTKPIRDRINERK